MGFASPASPRSSGTPDLVFPTLRKVIFVHGCFGISTLPSRCEQPSANLGTVRRKLARNVERDYQAGTRLAKEGWDVLVIWNARRGRLTISWH